MADPEDDGADEAVEAEDAGLAPVLDGLYEERFRRALEMVLRGYKIRSGRATWRGRDRFEIHGTFTLLDLTCLYVAARECYPAGTIEGRRDRGTMPPGW